MRAMRFMTLAVFSCCIPWIMQGGLLALGAGQEEEKGVECPSFYEGQKLEEKDLANVEGIGPATIEKLRDKATVR